MRVFKRYCFDLKDTVLFKDTLAYAENFLAEQCISYDHLGFLFSGGVPDHAFKLLEKYPHFQVYRKNEADLSSLHSDPDKGFSLHMNPGDTVTLREIAQKIPRPFNFGGAAIVLDHVHWFEKINPLAVIHLSPSYSITLPCGYVPELYMSNSLMLKRQFDYGKKKNPVIAHIEITADNDSLLDDDVIRGKLVSAFGEIKQAEIITTFTKEEEDINKRALCEVKPIINGVFDELQHRLNYPVQLTDALANNTAAFSRVSGLSPRKAILKLCKKYEFQYTFDTWYQARMINEHQHGFSMEFDLSPHGKRLTTQIHIQGYNFDTTIYYKLDLYPDTQITLEKHIFTIADHIMESERRLREPLYNAFGATPGWFWI